MSRIRATTATLRDCSCVRCAACPCEWTNSPHSLAAPRVKAGDTVGFITPASALVGLEPDFTKYRARITAAFAGMGLKASFTALTETPVREPLMLRCWCAGEVGAARVRPVRSVRGAGRGPRGGHHGHVPGPRGRHDRVSLTESRSLTAPSVALCLLLPQSPSPSRAISAICSHFPVVALAQFQPRRLGLPAPARPARLLGDRQEPKAHHGLQRPHAACECQSPAASIPHSLPPAIWPFVGRGLDPTDPCVCVCS